MIPCCFFSAVILFFARFVRDLPGLIVFSVLYGLISGGMISLPAPIIANLSVGSNDLGVRMGMAYTIAAFGGLVGNPIAGAAKGAGGNSSKTHVQMEYQGIWFVGAVGMMFSTLLLLATKRLKVGGFLARKKV